MFGTINAVTDRGIDFYKSLAANATTAVSPPSVFGGVLVLNPAPPNTSTTSTSTSATTATLTSTSTGTETTTGTGTTTGTTTGSGTAPPTTTATAGAGAKGVSFVGVVGAVVAALVMA
jgi:hypothetical protein